MPSWWPFQNRRKDRFKRRVIDLLEAQLRELSAQTRVLRQIMSQLPNRVLGGELAQTGDPMVPIQPGNTPKFLVTPAFSGAPFTLDGAKAAISSSDPTNFPVQLDLAGDPQGLTFEAPIPAMATPTGGSEQITVTWTYTNLDGTVATVSGTVTEQGIVDDVTGGTFAQIA